MIKRALVIVLMLTAAGASPVIAAELPEMIIRNVSILAPGTQAWRPFLCCILISYHTMILYARNYKN